MDEFHDPDPANSQASSQYFTSAGLLPDPTQLPFTYDQLFPAAGEGNPPVDGGMNYVYDDYYPQVPELMNEAAGQNGGNQVNVPLQPAYDPRALLNPKASSSKRPAFDAGGEHGLEQGDVGQLTLVERLHNVHYRTASPAKRTKTEDEAARQQRSAMSSGSTLAVEPQIGGPAPPPPSQFPAIDLTMSDDEEVEVVKDNGKQIICIGRVKQAYVQCHVVPFPDPAKYRGNAGSQGRIKVSFRRNGSQRTTNVIMVVDPTGKEFGKIDLKTAQGLAPLMDASKLNNMMWIASTDVRRKQPGEGPPGTPLSTLVSLTLQLYCPRNVARDIGKFLDSRNIKLGDPAIEIAKFDYYNPQTTSCYNRKEASDPEFTQNHSGSSFRPLPIERTVEEIRSDVLNMFDNMADQSSLPRRKQSPIMKTQLLKHQEQALYFMTDKEREFNEETDIRKDSLWKVKHENNGRKIYVHVITGQTRRDVPQSIRGGILADEMGLGKTLSVLSLIVDPDSVAAARQFEMKAPKPLPNGTRRHLINSRATLLLCPLSTMVNWKQQISDHFGPGSGFRWTYYHGADRKNLSVHDLANYDLVITTYHMVAADAFDKKKPLGHINWFRIVLDEAHQIRSGTSKQALAVYELGAQRRWAVTGTPVQNRLEDMYALFKFLRVKPFSESAGFKEFILRPFKDADEEVVPKLQLLVGSLTLRRLKEGNIVLPPRTDTIVRLKFSEDEQRLHDWFERESARQVNAVTSGEKIGGAVYARILKAILYLRLISAHGRDLLSDDALKLTEGMSSDNPMELNDEEEQIPALTSRAAYEMLELLNQTDTDRCQYPTCRRGVFDTEADESDSDDSDEVDGQSKKSDLLGHMTPCYHIICPRHVKNLQSEWDRETAEGDQVGQVTCQFCDQRIRPVVFDITQSGYDDFRAEQERIKRDPKLAKKMGAYTGPHTKTKALLEDLKHNAEESAANPNEPPIKSVIFSYWTTHLDLIQIALDNHGHAHKYTRLDGRMDRKSRDRALQSFATDSSITIILVSIGAGGLGLNLTTANKVYVMEPQFNPAAEAQAVDRVHRLGQTRPVTIKRFIMDGSFEEKMLELQRKKTALADLTMAREKASKEQVQKQKLEDLRSLFR